jgi:hypothetical protein
VSISQGNPHAEAFVENNHRADLNPIEQALGLKALAEEFGLGTNKKIAAKVRKSEQWVGDHLRLLKLPEQVQSYFAAGVAPMAAESLLRPIAEISPEVAAAICEVGKAHEYTGRQFVDHFAQSFRKPAGIKLKGKPPMIKVPRLQLSEAIPALNPEKNQEHRDLIDRILEIFHNYDVSDPTVELGEPEIDAARAAGCLVEHQGRYGGPSCFLLDREFTVDLIERAVDRRQKEAVERAEAKAAEKAKRREESQKARAEREARGEKTPQARAKAEAELARRFNDDLGGKLLKRRSGGKCRKDVALTRAKAIARLVVAQNPDLAGRGLRYTIPTLQEVEVKQLKNGGKREKVTYADNKECTVELLRRIDAARSDAEVNEVLSEAFIAALVADNQAEPQSRRPRPRRSASRDGRCAPCLAPMALGRAGLRRRRRSSRGSRSSIASTVPPVLPAASCLPIRPDADRISL